MESNASEEERRRRIQQQSAAEIATGRDDADEDSTVSPFSFRSLETGNSSSLGGADDAEDASDSWSVDVASSSSNQTGQVSLARRAREFEQLLQSQQRVLTDFDSPSLPRPETEDDGLQTELQDLARSELLLRKELEIFASSFRRNSDEENNVEDDEEDHDYIMDEVSPLPGVTDPARISNAASPVSPPPYSPPPPLQSPSPPLYYHRSSTPASAPVSPPSFPIYMSPHIGLVATPGIASASGLTTTSGMTTTTSPGMAPKSPDDPRSSQGRAYRNASDSRGPDLSSGSGHVSPINSSLSTPQDLDVSGSGSHRVSLENEADLGLPTLESLRQRRLSSQPYHPSPSFDSPVEFFHSESPEDRPYMMLPTSMAEASHSTAGRRPPKPPGASLGTPAPRVSLDQEVPSLLGTTTAAAQRPLQSTTPDLRSDDSDDSMFFDLAQSSSGTPRASNTRDRENTDSSWILSTPDSPPPNMPEFTLYPTPQAASNVARDFWSSDTPVTASVAPAVALHAQDSPGRNEELFEPSTPDASTRSFPPFSSTEEEIIFASHTEEEGLPSPIHHENDSNDELNVSREDQIGLLDDFIGASWKLSENTSSAAVPVGNDDEVATPPRENEHETQTSQKKPKKLKHVFSGIWNSASGTSPLLLNIDTSEDADSTVPEQRRRRCRGLALLIVLAISGIAAIVIPTSVVVSRDRRSASAAVSPGGDNETESMTPSIGPSWSGSLEPTLIPTWITVSNAPTSTSAPFASPSISPSAGPPLSMRPSVSQVPSSLVYLSTNPSVSLTPQPMTQVPSATPSTLEPSVVSSPSPSVMFSTDAFTTSPSEASTPTLQPTAVLSTQNPTVGESTVSPSTNEPTARPIQISAAPSSLEPTGIPTGGLLDDFQLGVLLLQNSVDGGAALNDSGSPQFAAYQWLLKDPNLSAFNDERRLQRYAMATIFLSLGGTSWIDRGGWLSNDDHECDWFSRVTRGVCSGLVSRRMRRLVLYYNNLHGSLPNEIGLLTDLREINLMGGPDRYINGSLPLALGSLSSLQLVQLSDNALTGTLASAFSSWTDLELLDISQNQLNGPLTDELIGSWDNLIELDLSTNRLSGTMPQGWTTSLQFLNLNHNQMSGPVPASIGSLNNLRILKLDHNQFSSLPISISGMQKLQELSMIENALEGSIVSELGLLSHLRSVRLSNNLLNSTIPSELGGLGKLVHILDLSNNNLSGEIPTSIGEIENLRNLDLSANRLSGTIPETLADISRLSLVRLDRNDFNGTVPSVVCNIWDEYFTAAYADCEELDCPCCRYCCTDGEGCVCRYAGDPALDWQCI